jgi:hypothetical protein
MVAMAESEEKTALKPNNLGLVTNALEKRSTGNPKGVGLGKEKLMRQALMMELKSAGEDLPELRQIARRVIDCALNDDENWSGPSKRCGIASMASPNRP